MAPKMKRARHSAQRLFRKPAEYLSEVRNRIKASILIISAGLIVLIALLLLLGIKVSFLLNDELVVKLSPADVSLSLTNGESANINFSIQNDNFQQCRSSCELTLTDLADNSVIYSYTEKFEHGQLRTLPFTLKAPAFGEGQNIYVFQAECRNIRSVVCLTNGEPRRASSIVYLNYKLSPDAESAKEGIKPMIEALLASIQDAEAALNQTTHLSGLLNGNAAENARIRNNLTSYSKRLQGLAEFGKTAVELWDLEEYLAISATGVARKQDEADFLNAEIQDIRESLDQLIGIHNDSVDIIEQAYSLKWLVNESALFHASQAGSASSLKLGRLAEIASRIVSGQSILSGSSPYSELSVNSDLKLAVDGLMKELADYQSVQRLGAFLQLYSKSLLAVKNSEQLNYSTFSCQALRQANSDAEQENQKAEAFRKDNYLWSIGNASFDEFLDNAAAKLQLNALLLARASVPSQLVEFIDSRINSTGSVSGTSGIPDEDSLAMAIIDSREAVSFARLYCGNESSAGSVPEELNSYLVTQPSLKPVSTGVPIASLSRLMLSPNPEKCCTFSQCQACLDGGEPAIPVLFIHGHALNDQNTPALAMNAFTKLQSRLQDDGFINAGELDLSRAFADVKQGEWGMSGRPVTARASYYYIAHYAIGGVTLGAQKSERIENYAIRLKDIIALLKYRTGSSKVNIVAHSMGGKVCKPVQCSRRIKGMRGYDRGQRIPEQAECPAHAQEHKIIFHQEHRLPYGRWESRGRHCHK
ncbi:hypothetical protein J4475_03065 [Candidatus Woesearchaeota archaeon]|nr:hypothetical protein [Candidatus Woesearchaeota archaeon]